ncbi:MULTISPECIES: helix-turn-helix domain-containing protein [Bordetella]|uniref:Transcriptional regulator n=2 Tax=Bordetella TaxID=517 RepID=A0A261W1R8_9BORD|nr:MULTISPECIES: helix-turn-helix transcriptional regulator [Bordetella]MDM9558639.1 helix-turn-helix transcriptional regulator [Bordetella petrii]OZI79820.1 transcriptional regulator [Bordetella genomosp. 2]
MTQDLDPAVPRTESPAAAPSVGQALHALRVAKGWSLDEVSSRIKFSARQIQALESEQWAKLPTGVSLRGLIRSYARLLDADAPAIVASLESRIAAAPAGAPGRRLAHTVPVPISSSDDDRSSMPWGWLLVIAALLAVLVAYAFWQGWLPADWLPWFSPLNS